MHQRWTKNNHCKCICFIIACIILGLRINIYIIAASFGFFNFLVFILSLGLKKVNLHGKKALLFRFFKIFFPQQLYPSSVFPRGRISSLFLVSAFSTRFCSNSRKLGHSAVNARQRPAVRNLNTSANCPKQIREAALMFVVKMRA